MPPTKMIVYDYDDRPKEIELPGKEIESISVLVLSGDETGVVNFTDGTELDFDASYFRFESFFDGYYRVTKDQLDKWFGFDAKGKKYLSYTRQRLMSGGDPHD